MIRKIVLSNFMAHANTELVLAEGLTVLVGPNNVGKSTVAVALKILARNTNSNFVMQHEQKECSISVETSEGHSIQWVKRKSPSYVINGRAKDRLGRGGTPPELDNTLRLAAVEFEDKDFEPHFGDQKSPIFLINRPPSQIAQFFSTTSDAEKLVAMQRLHQRHRTEAQTQAKLLSTRNDAIQQKLVALESLPVLDCELFSLEREANSLASLDSEITNLEKLIKAYAQLSFEQQFELHRATCLERLVPLPVLHSTMHMESITSELEITSKNYCGFREAAQLLSSLVSAPCIVDDLPLKNIAKEIEKGIANCEYCHERMLAQATLAVPPDYSVPADALACMVGELERASRDQMRLDSLLSVLMPLATAPVLPDVSTLHEAINAFDSVKDLYEKNQLLLIQVHESIVDLENTAAQWLSTEPTCSTCGSKLSADAFRFKSIGMGVKP